MSLGVTPPRDNSLSFNWRDDYPRHKAYDRNVRPTNIRLTFELDEAETSRLYETIRIRSNGTLALELELPRDSVSLRIVNPDGGAACHRKKAHKLAKFVSESLSYISVPETKNGRAAQSLMDDLVRMRFQSNPRFAEYRMLADKLDRLRLEATSDLGEELTKSVMEFRPDVETFEITTAESAVVETVTNLHINDGSFTSIENKGAGFQSLVATVFLHKLVEEYGERKVVVVVDQPETHLDGTSDRKVRSLLDQISLKQQVVIATHDPMYVNRKSIASNVVVRTGSACAARSADHIRGAMGLDSPENEI